MARLKYTTVLHEVRISLGLSLLEYCLADVIYHLSHNPQNTTGWCWASKETLAEMIGTTDRTIYTALDTLEEKGLIQRHKETKHLKTTSFWYGEVIAVNMKNLQSSDDSHIFSHPLKKLQPTTKETSYNNNIYNNKDISPYGDVTSSQNTEEPNILKEETDNLMATSFQEETIETEAEAEAKEQFQQKENVRLAKQALIRQAKKTREKKNSPMQQDYREINDLTAMFKEKFGLPVLDGTYQTNRNYCFNLLRRHKREGVEVLIEIASKDSYWGTKITSFKTLFNNSMAILSKIKESPKSVRTGNYED